MTTQSEDNKELRILDSALTLFVEKGFHGTSTTAISGHAGVSTGILFHYFSTKKNLIIDLFLKIKTEFFTLLFQHVDDSSFENSILSLWNTSIQWALENRIKFRFLTLYHNSPFYQEVKNNVAIQEYDNSFSRLYQKGIDIGYFKDVEVELLKNNAFNLIISFIESVDNLGGYTKELDKQGWDCFISSLRR